MIEFYTVATANGQRAGIALEECGLDYETTLVDLYGGEHRSPEMLALNPVGRMPFIVDRSAGGGLLHVYGSLAIGQYACERVGRFVPRGLEARADLHTWVGIVMTDLAPALAAQFALSVLSPEPNEWALDYFTGTALRLVDLLNRRLADNAYLLGDDYSLVDMMAYPTVATSLARLPGGIESCEHLRRWSGHVGARPAVIRGMEVSSSR